MMLRTLALPRLAGDMVCARRRLGRGLRLAYDVAGQAGELLLEPGRPPVAAKPLCFETACGVIGLVEAGPLLSLMGECPVPLAQTDNDPDSWVWALFQQHLSPQLQALLGDVRLLETQRLQGFGCRLSVLLGEARAVGFMWLAPETFLALCDAGQWRPAAALRLTQFPLAIAVSLGRIRLATAQVRGLRSGDVLVFEQTFFQAQGTGRIQVGRQCLHGCIDDATGALCFTLDSIEDMSVHEKISIPDYSDPEDDHPVVDVFGQEPFDELSMALNVRCGTLSLTLGELRNLAPGAVLGIAGYAPGMAGLYYGDRPIGQGQLVDVDGRLGLQLTRVSVGR